MMKEIRTKKRTLKVRAGQATGNQSRFSTSGRIRMVVWMLIILIAVPCTQAGTFRDDFEDGNLEGWRQEWPNDAMFWKVVDGKLECTRQDSFSTVLITGEATWEDYTIEFDVELLEDFGPGDVDVIVRHINFENHTMLFGFGDFIDNPMVFIQRYEPVLLIDNPFNPLKLNQWHHFTLEATDRHFIFWLNGEEIFDYEEPLKAFQAGAVGLGLANYTARFDNVVITGPDVPEVMPPTWKARSVQPREKLASMWGAVKRGL